MDWSKLKYRPIWFPILYSLTIACWDNLLSRTRVSHVGAIWKATVKTTTYIICQSSYTYHSTGEAEALGLLNYPHLCPQQLLMPYQNLRKSFQKLYNISHTTPHHTTWHYTTQYHTTPHCICFFRNIGKIL